jgi:glycosyltransferase involved in cell wall biosynthesis
MKKNIAIVITRLDLGGAQKVALYLAGHLDRKKFNVHFIAGKGGYLDEQSRISDFGMRSKDGSKSGLRTPDSGLQFHLWPDLIHPIHPVADAIALFKLYSYFKNNNIDIVHTHSSKAGILGRLAAWMAKVPMIIHTIHGFPFHEFQNPAAHYAYLLMEKMFAEITTKYIAVGKDVKVYGLKKGVGREEQYEIIRPGVDLKQFKIQNSKFKSERSAFLGKHGLKNDAFTVGMIGNCKKQKNPMAFADVARRVLKEKPDTQFIFAGDGPLKEYAQEYVKARKISDKVKFIGWTDEPEIFMKSIDLFLLTSLWEGIPCTLAQAAAAGKPIVASDIEGNREFMTETGAEKYLYKPKNTAEAAVKVVEVIKQGVKSYKSSPAKLLKEFNLKHMQKQHEDLYSPR